MNKKILSLGVLVVSCVLSFCINSALADNVTAGITYPVVELGNCADKQACAVYCSKPDNMKACITFAEKMKMMPQEEIDRSKRLIEKVQTGSTPGQCKNEEECEKYCDGTTEHIKECLAFAKDNDILPDDELNKIEKIADALEDGAQLPGQCGKKQDCEDYCEKTEHIDECLTFAEKAKILPQEEIEEARKISQFLKKGEMPGGCKTKEKCADFCSEDGHEDECLAFAEKAGLVSKEELDIAKKVGGKGPGGCKGEKECKEYCEDEDHAAECADFAVQKGLVSDDVAKKMQDSTAAIRKGLEKIPSDARPLVETCLKEKLGEEKYEAILSGTGAVTQSSGEKIEGCFEDGMDQYVRTMMDAPSTGSGQAPSTGSTNPSTGPSTGSGPNSGQNPSSGSGGMGIPPNTGTGSGTNMPTPDCSAFSAVPSCDMVPSGVAQDMCRKCK